MLDKPITIPDWRDKYGSRFAWGLEYCPNPAHASVEGIGTLKERITLHAPENGFYDQTQWSSIFYSLMRWLERNYAPEWRRNLWGRQSYSGSGSWSIRSSKRWKDIPYQTWLEIIEISGSRLEFRLRYYRTVVAAVRSCPQVTEVMCAGFQSQCTNRRIRSFEGALESATKLSLDIPNERFDWIPLDLLTMTRAVESTLNYCLKGHHNEQPDNRLSRSGIAYRRLHVSDLIDAARGNDVLFEDLVWQTRNHVVVRELSNGVRIESDSKGIYARVPAHDREILNLYFGEDLGTRVKLTPETILKLQEIELLPPDAQREVVAVRTELASRRTLPVGHVNVEFKMKFPKNYKRKEFPHAAVS